MKQATITFHKLIQNTQTITPEEASPNKFMESKVIFDLDIGDKHYANMSATLRQPYGTDYKAEPIEAEKPTGSYDCAKWNHNQFHDAAEDYYRTAISSGGGGIISVGPGSGVELRNNLFSFSKSYPIDIPD
jgi:hypothetical protein